MSRIERLRELGDAWALGALEPRELDELRELLDGASTEELDGVHSGADAAHLLTSTLEVVPPPPRVLGQILGEVRATQGEAEEGSRASRLAAWLHLDRPAAALGAIATLLVLALSLSLWVVALDRSAVRAQGRVADLTDQLEERTRLLEVLTTRQLQTVALTGLDLAPEGAATLLWDVDGGRALLSVSNLPPLEPESNYQLWLFVTGEGPKSLGAFAVRDASRDAFFRLDRLPALDYQTVRGLLVTREAATGADEPSELRLLGAYGPAFEGERD